MMMETVPHSDLSCQSHVVTNQIPVLTFLPIIGIKTSYSTGNTTYIIKTHQIYHRHSSKPPAHLILRTLRRQQQRFVRSMSTSPPPLSWELQPCESVFNQLGVCFGSFNCLHMNSSTLSLHLCAHICFPVYIRDAQWHCEHSSCTKGKSTKGGTLASANSHFNPSPVAASTHPLFLPPSIRSPIPCQLVEGGGRGWSRCEGRLGQEGGIQRRGRQKSTSPCWHSSLSRTFWTSFYTHAHKQVFSGTMGSLQTTWPAVSMVVESMCVCLHLVTKKINERHLTFEIQSGFAAGLLTAGLGRASGYCSHLVSGDEEINEDLRDNQVAACQLGSGFLSLFRPPWVSVNYTVGHTGVKRLQWNTWRPRRTRTNSKQTPKNTVNIRDKCSPHTHMHSTGLCVTS